MRRLAWLVTWDLFKDPWLPQRLQAVKEASIGRNVKTNEVVGWEVKEDCGTGTGLFPRMMK